MPTVILVDSSLSLSRLVGKTGPVAPPPSSGRSPAPETITLDDDVELRHLAVSGISYLLSQIEINCKAALYIEIIIYSGGYEYKGEINWAQVPLPCTAPVVIPSLLSLSWLAAGARSLGTVLLPL